MMENIKYYIVGIMLIIESVIDIKSRKINLLVVIIGTILGVIISVASSEYSVKIALGAIVGLIMLLVSYITREGVGYGDGIILISTGLMLGLRNNILILLWAVFICSIVSIILLIFKKADRKRRIPFVPFLAASFFITVLSGGFIG